MKKLKSFIGIIIIITNIACTTDDNDNEPEVMECDFPSNIVISNISIDSVTINWTEATNQTNVGIEYGLSGFLIGSGTTINSTESSYLIENLVPNTSYDIYIKTICDNIESVFSDVVSFTTLCETVYSGDIIFSNQNEIDNFSSCFTEIDGTLTIGASGSDITSLLPLNNINTIQGNLVIKSNDFLTSLDGLNNISTINSELLIIEFNESLENIDDLNGLTNIFFGNIQIRANDNLTSLSGLETLFLNQSNLNNINVSGNDALVSLNMQSITDCNVISINNNDSLISLQSLENLLSNTGMTITNNDILNNLCALQNLFTNGDYAEGFVSITGNQFNPSIQNIIDGNCSQ